MFLFYTIFINKLTKCHIFKVRGLNETFCTSKMTYVAFHPIRHLENNDEK